VSHGTQTVSIHKIVLLCFTICSPMFSSADQTRATQEKWRMWSSDVYRLRESAQSREREGTTNSTGGAVGAQAISFKRATPIRLQTMLCYRWIHTIMFVSVKFRLELGTCRVFWIKTYARIMSTKIKYCPQGGAEMFSVEYVWVFNSCLIFPVSLSWFCTNCLFINICMYRNIFWK